MKGNRSDVPVGYQTWTFLLVLSMFATVYALRSTVYFLKGPGLGEGDGVGGGGGVGVGVGDGVGVGVGGGVGGGVGVGGGAPGVKVNWLHVTSEDPSWTASFVVVTCFVTAILGSISFLVNV